MNQPKELIKILEEIELPLRERQVYMCLLELKQAKLNQVITKTNLGKSTVHQVLENLLKKGLIFTDDKKYDKTYQLYPPKRLLNLVANKRRKIRRLELEIEDVLPKLNTLYELSSNQPKIEFYNDLIGYTILCDRSLDVQSKISYYLGSLDNLLEVLGNNYDQEHYLIERVNSGIHHRLLTYRTPLMEEYRFQDKKFNRETKFLPKDFILENGLLMHDDRVTFFSPPEEKFALSITSPSIAKTQLTIFNKLWQMSG